MTAADRITDWVETETHVWKARTEVRPNVVIVDDVVLQWGGSHVDSPDEYHWRKGSLFIYSETDPGNRKVEVGRRDFAIHTNGQSHLVFEGLDIRGNNTEGDETAGIYINGQDVVLTDCVVQHNYYHSVRFKDGGSGQVLRTAVHDNVMGGILANSNSGQVVIEDCDIYNNGKIAGEARDGITAGTRAGLTVRNCRIYNNGMNGDPGKCHGIYLTGNGDQAVVESNDIWGNPTGHGIACSFGNAVIRYNKIYDNYVAGILMSNQPTDGTVQIYYNVIFNNNYGIRVHDWRWNSATRVQILNNVIYNNNTTAFNPEPANLDVRADTRELTIVNNVIFDSQHPGRPSMIRFWKSGRVQSNLVSDHNCLYNASGSDLVEYNNADYNFEGWQGLGQDGNSVSADPRLVNAGAQNFALQGNSPCIDRGKDVGLTRDFTGAAVPGGPTVDIGAFEFGGERDNVSPARPKNLRARIVD
ncbi:MAG: right-handed parallel beta-helix repeat-containing protein [Alphaproteobacteria bacterium]|nr:MAG: right-handed parallel beta-helix repeat-containing protein [Alphaproteobacteria bacterium]